MLEMVKQLIRDLPCISFDRYYAEYVMNIQDANIDREMNSLRFSDLNSTVLNNMIDQELGSLHYD